MRAVHWRQWLAVGLLGVGTLVGGLTLGPLIHGLGAATHLALQELPTVSALTHFAASIPALLTVAILAVVVWWLQRRSRTGRLVSTGPADEPYGVGEGLARAARVLHGVVEENILDRGTVLVARTVVNGAHLIHRTVEREGLEGVPLRTARTVLALSRWLQRRHTGRLRRNLLWVAASLALVMLVVMLRGW